MIHDLASRTKTDYFSIIKATRERERERESQTGSSCNNSTVLTSDIQGRMMGLIRGGGRAFSQYCPMSLLLLFTTTILLLFKCNPIHANHLLPDNIEEAFRGLLEIFDAAGGTEFLELLRQQNNIVNNINVTLLDNKNTANATKSSIEDLLTAQTFPALDRIFGVECLRGLIRPNINQQLVHSSTAAYDTIGACLTDREGFVSCADASDGDDDQEMDLISFTAKLQATGAEFRYQSIGPEQLHGVFWLKYDGPFSSIMSFAQSNDGGILSPGVWLRDDAGIDYRTRVAGDRIWSMSVKDLTNGNNASTFENMQRIDLIYEYVVKDGTLEDPRQIQVFPTLNMRGDPCFRFHFAPCMDWYIYIDITLLTDSAEKGNYTNSVVWRRHTAGTRASREGNYTYLMIQIIDGNGQPIEPAYSDWLLDESHPDAGDQPNINWFRSVRDNAPLTSEAQSC